MNVGALRRGLVKKAREALEVLIPLAQKVPLASTGGEWYDGGK